VVEPHLSAETWQPEQAWRVRIPFAWPEVEDTISGGEPSLEGPWLEGPWAEGIQRSEAESIPFARRWMESALAARGRRRRVGRGDLENHPLLRQLSAAASAGDSSISDRESHGILWNHRPIQ
jgi:hypothetical protein